MNAGGVASTRGRVTRLILLTTLILSAWLIGVSAVGLSASMDGLITATNGPIVSGNNIVSVTIQGFSISGQNLVTTIVGLDLADSQLVLSNILIQGLHGVPGRAGQPDGAGAIAIRSTGISELSVISSTIQDIVGGDGLYGSGARDRDSRRLRGRCPIADDGQLSE